MFLIMSVQILSTIHNINCVIQIDNYIILFILQIFNHKNILFLSIQLDYLNYDKSHISNIFKAVTTLVTKYFHLYWNTVYSFNLHQIGY